MDKRSAIKARGKGDVSRETSPFCTSKPECSGKQICSYKLARASKLHGGKPSTGRKKKPYRYECTPL